MNVGSRSPAASLLLRGEPPVQPQSAASGPPAPRSYGLERASAPSPPRRSPASGVRRRGPPGAFARCDAASG